MSNAENSERGLSGRGFLAGAALGTMGLAASGFLGGCSSGDEVKRGMGR